MAYSERLVKRDVSGKTAPIEAGDARTLIGVPPISHASSGTTYGVAGVGVYGHAQASATLPIANSGVGNVGIETSAFARGDHYHPEITSVLQASRLSTGRYIGIGGGVTAEASQFNGESDLILQVSSVSADYLTGLVPVTVLPVGDGSDQVASGDHTHLYAASGSVGGAANLTVSSATTAASTYYIVGVTGASAALNYSTGISYNASTKILTATEFSGNLTGNVTGNCTGSSGSCTGNAATATSAGTCTGNAATATKLAAQVAISIGGSSKNFDGSGGIIWTLPEIGAAASTHYHAASAINSGQVTVPYGGTGVATFTLNGVLYGNGTGAIQATVAGTNGQLLAANSSGVPTFTTVNYALSGSVGGPASTTVSASSSTNASYSIVGVTAASGQLYFNSGVSFNPSTATLSATTFSGSLSGGSVSCTTLNASSTSTLTGNVGIGASSSAYYNLYIYGEKAISAGGTYMGCYVLSKFSTSISSGTRQGIGLNCQAWGVSGTESMTKLKALDAKAYIITGSSVTDVYAINATVQLDGGTATNLYCLYLGREGSATPSGNNYGIYQADTVARNVFKGYCQFDGGTNLGSGGGRIRNYRYMSESNTVDHTAGTDTLVIYEYDNPYGAANVTLTLPTATGSVSTGDVIMVYNCGVDNVTLASATSSKIKSFEYNATPVSSKSFSYFPELAHAVWDGTHWRVNFISLY